MFLKHCPYCIILKTLPKMHKSPIGARFIVGSRQSSTKALSKTVTKDFKIILSKFPLKVAVLPFLQKVLAS